MEKRKKSIYIIIIAILLIIVFAGTFYIIKNQPNQNNNYQKDNNQTNDNQTDNSTQKTMSTSELEELLSYIPNIHIAADGATFKDGIAYSAKKSTVDNIDLKHILGMALRKLGGAPDVEYSKSTVESMTKKMYNISSIDVSESDTYVAEDGGMCYLFKDGNFYGDYCAPGGIHFSSIEDYEVTEDELIIYEIVAQPYEDFSPFLYDYYTTKEIDTNIDTTDSDKYLEEMENYFNLHKNEFTKYKNTFKKNDLGYYWYSTEVAE